MMIEESTVDGCADQHGERDDGECDSDSGAGKSDVMCIDNKKDEAHVPQFTGRI
jgi:hypothetical protein